MGGKVHSAEIPMDFVSPSLYHCSVRPFIDVFVEVLHRIHRATDLHFDVSIVLGAHPWVVWGDPLVRQEYAFLQNGSSVARSLIRRKSFDLYWVLSESLWVSLRTDAIYHAWDFWARRASWAVNHRRRYCVP